MNYQIIKNQRSYNFRERKHGVIWNIGFEGEEIKLGLEQQLGSSSEEDLGGPGWILEITEIISSSAIHL